MFSMISADYLSISFFFFYYMLYSLLHLAYRQLSIVTDLCVEVFKTVTSATAKPREADSLSSGGQSRNRHPRWLVVD